MPSVDQFIVWIVVGLLGGSLAGLLVTWDRAGFGFLRNLGVGLVGALVGGLIFRLWSPARPRQNCNFATRCCVSPRWLANRACGSLALAKIYDIGNKPKVLSKIT